MEQAGKIRAFGVSNFEADQLERAIDLFGHDRIACNQILYHLGERQVENDLLPLCERSHVALVGYSPFAQGAFRFTHPVLTEIGRAHGATPRRWRSGCSSASRRSSRFRSPPASSTWRKTLPLPTSISPAMRCASMPPARRRRGLRML